MRTWGEWGLGCFGPRHHRRSLLTSQPSFLSLSHYPVTRGPWTRRGGGRPQMPTQQVGFFQSGPQGRFWESVVGI